MTPNIPKDPDELSLQPSRSAGTGAARPDFSDVQSGSDTVPGTAHGGRPDFSDVQSHTDTVPADAGTQSYTVQEGDTLSHIAQRHYGRASRWHAIFEANRDQLDDPDRIYPGQVLRLPPE